MPIWSAEIKELEKLFDSFKGQLRELEKELGQLIHFEDPNVILLYSRRCLEVIITDLCECELKRERGTEPLKGIIDKLKKEKKVPGHLASSMYSLNDLSTYGTHPKDFDPEQVKPVLNNLDIIVKWYLRYKSNEIFITPSEVKEETITVDGKQKTDKTRFEKSIAVLPFINDSPDQENTYFINGVMEEILNNLQKIKDLRVISRTSVEQFRESKMSVNKIAKELGVNYIVEGSGQKYGTSFRLRTQLIMADHETHVWGESFQKKITDVEDIFSIQIQIAESIASELKAVIAPEEKQLIEKIPTLNLTAYDLTLQAQKIYYDYILSTDKNKVELEKIKQLCKASLELDPRFAQAYYWLGTSSLSDQYATGHPLPFYHDTALYFFSKAIELDPTFAEAYAERGRYYMDKALKGKSIDDLNKSISLSPNNSMAYYYLGCNFFFSRDYVDAIKNFKKAIELTKSDPLQMNMYLMMVYTYLSVGDLQKAELICQELEQFNPENAIYQYWILLLQGKNEEALLKLEKHITLYPQNAWGYYFKTRALLHLGRIQEAEDCIGLGLKYSELNLSLAHHVGIVLWMNGKKDEAMKYFNMQINNCIESINSKNEYGQLNATYDLAGVYATLGNNEEAYRWLKEYEKIGFITGMHEEIKVVPLFDNLRNDDEFKEIVKRADDKAAEARARINELEEQGML